MKCKNRWELSGSSTVEATLILPLIIAAVFAFFWLIFFMYARIKLDADMDSAAIEAAQYIAVYGKPDTESELISFTDKNIRDYPYYFVTDKTVELERTKIKTRASLRLMNRMGFSGTFADRLREITSSTTVDCWNCPTIKRLIDTVMQMKQEE